MGPEIVITTDETAVNNQAIAALAHDPDIYQRGTILVHVVPQPAKPKGVRRPDGTPTIVPIRRALLQERMSKAARWCALSAKDELVSAHPPKWSIEAILQRGIWSGLRHLEESSSVRSCELTERSWPAQATTRRPGCCRTRQFRLQVYRRTLPLPT